MKNRIPISILLIMLIMASACKQNEQQVEFELSTPVSVMVLKPTVIEEYINTTGNIFPVHEATITSRVEGDYYLRKNPRTGKPYALGDRVKKGEVIIKFEDKEYENEVQVETQKLTWEISQMEYDKQKSLYEKGGVTLRELKDAEIDLQSSKINYENAQLSMEKMKVAAPFGGIITDIPYFTDGTLVSSGTEVLTLMDYHEMLLDVNLPEKNYSQVKVGQDVLVSNYSMPDDTLHGTIDQISPAIDSDARTFKCVVSIENSGYKLLPGMFVKADLVINRQENALVIPKEIVRTRGSSNSVYAVEQGAASYKRITLGITNEGNVMVTSGLSAGDRVVIKGYETLRNRSKVKIINEEVQEGDGEEQNQGEEQQQEGPQDGEPQGPPPGGDGGQGPPPGM